MSPKNFPGFVFELGPGRISPENSVFEAMERRRAEGEEAVREMARRKWGECKGLAGSKAAKDKNTELLHRAVWDAYMGWKKKHPKVHPKLSLSEFRKELNEHLPKRLRFFGKRLKPKGKPISLRKLKTILAPFLQAK